MTSVARDADADTLFAPPVMPADRTALFLDFDGTLVDLAEAPDAIAIDEGLAALIARVAAKLDGRLALVSGRPAGDLARFLDVPVTIVGSHGMEFRWADGTRQEAVRPEAMNAVVTAMYRFAAAEPGVIVEVKPLGAALHYRRAPHLADRAEALALEVGGVDGLLIQRGKMMVEVRAAGGDKGSALRRLMQGDAMAGAAPIFLGDDVTDEDAFEVARDMGGAGVLVGDARETAASYRLANVAAVHRWLAEIAA
ncbi:Trehalose 6-phosphate phosphatase [Sphingomonas sp. EC-HK361]|uniref:trehalose-phosphatase n=1 Tax=Sphingomonas sp. EC-HK361 TaxID=2038397 RepID=UPI001254AC06|nr:trehalose-phosphatase [Sphingomonas sp. EC-HK361]VVT20143.1 Trehalose 6-phosphate phosphatase [Sphingomonas sp. EC-HK361]